MIVITTNNKSFKLPTSVSEITLQEYCDFIEHDENFYQGKEVAEQVMIDSVKVFHNDIDDMLVMSADPDEVTIEYLYFHYRKVLDGYWDEILEQTERVIEHKKDLDDKKKTELLNLIQNKHQLTLFQKCELGVYISSQYGIVDHIDDLLHFEHNNKQYNLKRSIVETMTFKNNFTAGEFISVQEFRKPLVQDYHNDKKIIDTFGTLQLTLGLRMLATLVREGDEKLPFDKEARESFIQNKMNELSDIPMNIAYNLVFFLTLICGQSIKVAVAEDMLRASQSLNN